MVGPVVIFLVTVIGFCCRACEVLIRPFSPYVSIFGLVFSYWLNKFNRSKVPHGGSWVLGFDMLGSFLISKPVVVQSCSVVSLRRADPMAQFLCVRMYPWN